jgi:hypothetical protein
MTHSLQAQEQALRQLVKFCCVNPSPGSLALADTTVIQITPSAMVNKPRMRTVKHIGDQ